MWRSFNYWKVGGEILVSTFELRWRLIERLILYWCVYYRNIDLAMSLLPLLVGWFAMSTLVNMSWKVLS